VSLPDWLVLVAAFLLGAGAATIAWWIWQLSTRTEASTPAPVSPPPTESLPRSAAAVDPASRPKPASDSKAAGYLRTSQRVILHLAHQPRLAHGDVAPPAVTQAGMAHSLSVAQPALARVLARLVDGDAVLVMRTHVTGEARRLKVYQLTVHGEAIARDLRTRTIITRGAEGRLTIELRSPPAAPAAASDAER
jgi:DNA-binding MarR family transcriptional regulator